MVYVKKSDGTKQEFDGEKVKRTCLKLGVSPELADTICKKVEGKLYNGITTKKILQMVFEYAKKYKPEIKHRDSLRHAIAVLRSKPDFEEFIRVLLREHGYKVLPNMIISGKCVEHEIDGVVQMDGQVIYLEVKHHEENHTYTGLDVLLETSAVLDDLVEGGKIGKNKFNFTKAMVVCNTKVSEHAQRYADCRGISYMSWSQPEKYNLVDLIEKKELYPVTILKELDKYTQNKLGDNDIVTLKQLINSNTNDLVRKGINRNNLENLINKAKSLVKF